MSTLSKNTVFRIYDGSSNYDQITGVTDVSWDGVSWSTETTTNHDNSTPVETMSPTIYTNGTFKLTILWDKTNTQHAALRTLSTSGAAQNFQIAHVNSGEEKQFSGYCTAFAFDTPVDGLLKANVTISVNGAMSDVS